MLFCKITFIFLLMGGFAVLIDASSDPHDCIGFCPEVYDPVCASNGWTYNNDCELQAMIECEGWSISKRHDQACGSSPTGLSPPPECHSSCPRDFAPVCGSDNKTYLNECVFRVASCWQRSLDKVSEGACGWGKHCLQHCPEVYDPVCGSNGRTYVNDCELQAAIQCRGERITKLYDQACECHANCPLTHDPVCGTDDKTYYNECFFAKASCWDRSISKKKDGPCDKKWTYPFEI